MQLFRCTPREELHARGPNSHEQGDQEAEAYQHGSVVLELFVLVGRTVLRPDTKQVVVVQLDLREGKNGDVRDDDEDPAAEVLHNVALVCVERNFHL